MFYLILATSWINIFLNAFGRKVEQNASTIFLFHFHSMNDSFQYIQQKYRMRKRIKQNPLTNDSSFAYRTWNIFENFLIGTTNFFLDKRFFLLALLFKRIVIILFVIQKRKKIVNFSWMCISLSKWIIGYNVWNYFKIL